MTEFRPLVDATRVVQRRTLANSLLHHWSRCLAWSLAGVLLAASVLSLHAVLIAAAVLTVIATTVAFVATWVSRPSTYEAACRLDQAAGLHDRLSTALHFSTTEHPDEMVERQRRDALRRLAEADPRALFTLRVPASIGRTAAIALAVVGLMVYRVNHKPPLLAVSEQVAQTRLARAILTPRPPEKEKEFKEKLVLADEREAVDPDSNEKAGLDEAPDSEGEKASTSQEQGDPTAPSDDQASADEGESAEADPNNAAQEADRQAQQGEGRQPGDRQKQDRSEPGTPQPQDKTSSSLTQKITQAVKDLLAKATGQTPKEQLPNEKKMPPPPGGEQSQAQNPQPPNPNNQSQGGQPGKPQSQEASEAKANGSGPQMTGQQGEGNAPNGKGSGTPQLSKNPTLETHPTADVVPLEATTFKGQASVLTSAQAGQALVPLRDTAAQPTATTNGAEQGDVPLRYRAYLQQYFNHPDLNHPDKVQR